MRLPIPDDWDGEYCRYAVCWPNSEKWKAVLRGLVSQAARGWSWDERTGDLLQTLGAMRTVLPQNLDLKEVIMACGDQELGRIADAIFALARNQCCGEGAPDNGGVVGTISDGEGGTIPIYGSQPPGGVLPGNVPEGYEGDVEEYLQDKCNAAAAIVTGVIQTLRNFAYITFSQTAGLVTLILFAVAGFVVFPPFLVPVLIAAAIGLVGIQAGLLGLANGMQDRYDDLVCALYIHDSAEAILSAVSAIIGSIIVLIPATGAMAAFLRLVAGLLFNTDTLNQLFTLQAGFGEAHDCSSCGEFCPENVFVSVGSIVSQSEGSITIASVMQAGLHRINVLWNVVDTGGSLAYCRQPGIELTNVTTTNNLAAMVVEDNPDNTLIDDTHFHPPNSNLPVFPYENVGRCLCAFNSGQSGQMTFTFAFPEEE